MAITLKPFNVATFAKTAVASAKPPMTVGTGMKGGAGSFAKVEPQLVAQVSARIAEVRETQKSAVAQLRGKFLGGEPAAHAAGAIEGLGPRVADWAKRGEAAAKSGGVPGAKGWPGWIDDGEVLLRGMQDLAGFGLDANLDEITASVTAIPADTAKAVTAIAKKSAEVLEATADVTGGVVGKLIRPLLLPLAIAAVGLVAFAVIRSRA